MYGTIMRARLKKDCLREFLALGKEWDAYHRARALGYISAELLYEDAAEGRIAFIVHFANREQYVKNANSPEQNAFYVRMRACMEEDPVWIDGTFERWDSAYAKPPSKG